MINGIILERLPLLLIKELKNILMILTKLAKFSALLFIVLFSKKKISISRAEPSSLLSTSTKNLKKLRVSEV
jgi:hypothetical protein